MDTNALWVVFTFAGIQFVLCWNFHRNYRSLHKEFKTFVDTITKRRQEIFGTDLLRLTYALLDDFKELRDKGKGEMKAKHALTNPEYAEKVKSLYTSVVEAEEPLKVYNQTREAVRTSYRYFMISAVAALVGVIPAITSDPIFNILYAVFLLPLIFALIAWEEFYGSEKRLIELRDKGE